MATIWIVAAVLLGVSAACAAAAGAAGVAHGDFDARYAAAVLLRSGQAATAYSSLSNGLSAEGGLPALWMPPALLLVLPLSWLPLPVAAAIWDALQVTLLAAAAALVAFRTDLDADISFRWRAGAALLGFAGAGTLEIVALGQWDGVPALGLALGWIALQRDRDQPAMIVVAATALAGKPHLAAGVIIWMIARRPRTVLSFGLVAIATAVLSVALVPAPALVDWMRNLLSPSDIAITRTGAGLPGLVTMLGGSGSVTSVLAVVTSLAALAVCALLGRRQRAAPGAAVFASVLTLSLLASPHTYPYDLVLLAPGVVAMLVSRARQPAAERSLRVTAISAWWILLSGAAFVEVVPLGSFDPKPYLPLVLIAGAAAAGISAIRQPARASFAARPRPTLG
ncbi:MAG: DUF2029 domain-containing protein [Candidatus Dormibacteraeota bacterium]|nr:DUF2029 domain-containing protein [Candidatus Dormibacteraeota bacterium]